VESSFRRDPQDLPRGYGDHRHQPSRGAVFRRSTVQVRNEGGLWDESEKLYPAIGASPKEHVLQWSFPSGASVSFAHLEHDKTVLNWQGSQIPLICFDELTHFSAKQFWYMVSRNRSMSGVRPYIRATCNPDADSWVVEFISWWIDQDTGLPIPERAGVLRTTDVAEPIRVLILRGRPSRMLDW